METQNNCRRSFCIMSQLSLLSSNTQNNCRCSVRNMKQLSLLSLKHQTIVIVQFETWNNCLCFVRNTKQVRNLVENAIHVHCSEGGGIYPPLPFYQQQCFVSPIFIGPTGFIRFSIAIIGSGEPCQFIEFIITFQYIGGHNFSFNYKTCTPLYYIPKFSDNWSEPPPPFSIEFYE